MLVPVITELPNDSLPAIAFSDPAALCVLRVFVVSFRSLTSQVIFGIAVCPQRRLTIEIDWIAAGNQQCCAVDGASRPLLQRFCILLANLYDDIGTLGLVLKINLGQLLGTICACPGKHLA